MQSAFDTRAARFDPEQTVALSAAYQLALKALPGQRVPANTKSKLAKVIVNLGRERMRKNMELDVDEISSKAAWFVTNSDRL